MNSQAPEPNDQILHKHSGNKSSLGDFFEEGNKGENNSAITCSTVLSQSISDTSSLGDKSIPNTWASVVDSTKLTTASVSEQHFPIINSSYHKDFSSSPTPAAASAKESKSAGVSVNVGLSQKLKHSHIEDDNNNNKSIKGSWKKFDVNICFNDKNLPRVDHSISDNTKNVRYPQEKSNSISQEHPHKPKKMVSDRDSDRQQQRSSFRDNKKRDKSLQSKEKYASKEYLKRNSQQNNGDSNEEEPGGKDQSNLFASEKSHGSSSWKEHKRSKSSQHRKRGGHKRGRGRRGRNGKPRIRNSTKYYNQHHITPYSINPSQATNDAISQVEYFFSIEELCKNVFMRRNMDVEGCIPAAMVFNFPSIFYQGVPYYDLIEALTTSNKVEVDLTNETLRLKGDFTRWLYPNIHGGFGVERWIKCQSEFDNINDFMVPENIQEEELVVCGDETLEVEHASDNYGETSLNGMNDDLNSKAQSNSGDSNLEDIDQKIL